MDVYVIYRVLCVDIYVISLFALMESKKQKKHFPLFAKCRDHGTRQSWEPETQFPSFAECQSHGTRLSSAAEVALDKEAVRVDVGFFFAEC